VRELSEAEFKATFADPMVPQDSVPFARAAKAYVDVAIASRHGAAPECEAELSKTYLCGDGRHAHLLFWYGVPNVYAVVVLSMPDGTILGHHRLDLNEKYGLPLPVDRTWWPDA
jgi:hypothetical protein